MTELNITRFFNEACPMDYSASQMELGGDAGRITWQAACDDSANYMFLDTDEKREAFRVFVKGFGAWSGEEVAAWSDTELNALCIQFVAGDIREAGLDVESPDWQAYEANDAVAGRLFKGTDGEIYFYIGD